MCEMAEDDCEIEYLDEDEELVQNYVQNVSVEVPQLHNIDDIAVSIKQAAPLLTERKQAPLLTERKQVEKRKKVEIDDDSDYDPSEDLLQKFPKKRRKTPSNKKTPKIVTNLRPNTITLVPRVSEDRIVVPAVKSYNKVTKPAVNEIIQRKQLGICIPDYEDALCLPVRAISNDEHDRKRLRHWNNLCLDYFSKADIVVQPEDGKSMSSSRVIVFKNAQNRETNRVETSIWGKTYINNKRRSENFHGVLPRYREKIGVTSFKLKARTAQEIKHSYEVLLSKEDFKGEQFLVAYHPKTAISAVYKDIENTSRKKESDTDIEDIDEEKPKMVLKETTACKICAPCYQMSWRGVRKVDGPNKHVRCVICARSFVSVYNLLAHLKSHHAPAAVRARAADVAHLLARMVEYHYKCRICQEQFPSIKELRRHVPSHQGTEIFKCDVGNHLSS